MPFVGQDRFNNAARDSITRTAEQMRAVRGGQWGRIPQDNSAAAKSMEKRISTTRAVRGGEWGRVPQDNSAAGKSLGLRAEKMRDVRSGKYFPNNVGEKRTQLNAENIKRWMETDRAIKGGQ